MSIAVLKEITLAEEQAELIEAQARQKAKDIAASARRDAADVVEKATEQAEINARAIIVNSEAKAALDMKELEEKIMAQCQQIREHSGKKLDAAVNFIVGRIVKQSDR